MVPPELEFEKLLGQGFHGSTSLFKFSKPRTKLYTAVKTSDYKHSLSLDEEFKILSNFKNCPRIIQCYEDTVIENQDGEGNIEYMMLMEYAAEGSLRTFMKRFEDNKLPKSLIREFTRMLLEGLATIHEHGYVHCDLKPENIFVFPRYVYKNGKWRWSYELKISDFWLSKRDGESEWWKPHRPFVGTPIYMSPESISHGETGKGLDLWSLGCVVLEMYTGKRPWWHKNYDLEDLKNSYEPLIPSDLPDDAKHFIMTCFAPKADERTDALALLRFSFLKESSKVETSQKRAKGLKIITEQPRSTRHNMDHVLMCNLYFVIVYLFSL